MANLAEKQTQLNEARAKAREHFDNCERFSQEGKSSEAQAEKEKWQNAMTAAETLVEDIKNIRRMEKLDDETQPKGGGPKSGSGNNKKEEKDGGHPEDVPDWNVRPWGKSVTTGDVFYGRPSMDAPVRMKVGAFAPFASAKAASSPDVRKALYGSAESQGGIFVEPYRLPMLDRSNPLLRETRILDIINVTPVSTDQVEVIIEGIDETNNAAPVPEWDTGAGNFGLKPESDFGWTKETMNILTIATYVRASRQILADAPRMRQEIDTRLTRFVRQTLEAQVLSGNGLGNNMRGLLSTPGTLTRTHRDVANRGTVDDTIADTLRRGITDLMIEGFEPEVILVHPYVGEELELLKLADKQYLNIYDPVRQNIWRVPIMTSIRIPIGTAIIAELSVAATLFDRQDTEIRVGEPGDLFLRNAIAVLAELRAGFAVTLPKAINIIDLIP